MVSNLSAESGQSDYIPTGNEVTMFECAHGAGLPVLLKGPTGVGKTRFVEHMAKRLDRPLITVPCHEDLTAADLVGRFLLKGAETEWADGPLTRAVRSGAICYLDEVVEARADTVVVLHPLMDHRRELNIDRTNETLKAPPEFMIVMSFNPGYQSFLKELKPSTRQRMVGIDFDFPTAGVEARILKDLYGIDREFADQLVRLGQALRGLTHETLSEVSPRALINAGLLAQRGVEARDAAFAALASPLTDDPQTQAKLKTLIDTYVE